MQTEFKNGLWVWDDDVQGLAFLKHEKEESAKSHDPSIGALEYGVGNYYSAIKFKDVVDGVQQAQFKRALRRKVKPTEPDVVTIQDIKDVILFLARPRDLSQVFINFFHMPTMDRFLRSIIVYFQYYFQVWENILDRREEAKRKLEQPYVRQVEDVISDNLGDLRSVMSRDYGCLLTGIEEAIKYYHMAGKNNVSASEKDRRIYECLMSAVVKVIWIAHHRKNFSIIENEVNRLFRTDIFNVVSHRKQNSPQGYATTPAEDRYLFGKAYHVEKKLKHRSPVVQELIHADHDYKMLAIGVQRIETDDERQRFLEAAYTAPEELLYSLDIGIGLLGYPRIRLDNMLKPKERSKKDMFKQIVVIPEFNLPPRFTEREEKYTQTLPDNPPIYTETEATKRQRQEQVKKWLRYLHFDGQLEKLMSEDQFHQSFLDEE